MTFAVALAAVLSAQISTENLQPSNARDTTMVAGNADVIRTRQAGTWYIADSQNFSVWCHQSATESLRIARECERLRVELIDQWLPPDSRAEWTPKCIVVLNSDTAEYARHVGSHAAASAGCTTTSRDGGRTVYRRIDLRADAINWLSCSLPHEMTHVVFDAGMAVQLPQWAHEGAAMLAEAHSLGERRNSVLRRAVSQNALLSLDQLLSSHAMHRHADRDVFYAQSASLVKFLVDKKDEATFLEFVSESRDSNYAAAAREAYGFEDLSALHGAWYADHVEVAAN